MNDKKLNIKFKNYTPKSDERDFVLTIMRVMKQLSPCNSYIEISFNKNNERVFSDCKIVSFGKRFASRQNSNDTISVMKKIKKHIDSQLDHWRETRFNKTDIFNAAS